MRVINTSVNTLSTRYLVIGFEGENERTQIRIDAASVFAEYPQASPSMAVKPGFGEEVYPVIVTKEGNEVVWDVTQDNLDFTGDGEIQLTFIKDNVICKTTIGKIRVNRSLIVNGDPPEHLDTWYDEATAKLADVDEAINALEAMDAIAYGLPAGSDPTVELHDVEALGHKRFTFRIPKGDRGDRGATGNGIRSISQSGSTGLYKKYTIHFTDGNTTTFQVRDGDRGLKGDTGATPDISIGTVETLPAGSEATASMSGTAENPLLNLGIPKGDTGEKGNKGDKGDRGATPIFSMGAVTNLPAGTSATATITGTAEEPVLNLGIPKGDKGDKGDRGERGPQGIQGIQGDRGLTGPRGAQGQKGDKGDTGATGATGATPDFSIGTVSTLPAGSSATAEITGTAENPVLSLGIPQGAQGEKGDKGDKGDPGEGVPTGGITGQVLAKASDTDYDTEWIHVAPVIKNTASGAIASFPDGAEMPVDEVTAQINPVQDLHGYDNPWPAGGGKNLYDASTFPTVTIFGVTCTNNGDGSFTLNGTANNDIYFDIFAPQFRESQGGTPLPNGAYRITGCPTGGSTSTYYMYITPSYTPDLGNGNTNNDTTISGGSIFIKNGYTCNNLVFKPMIRTATNGDDTFAPYSNICPISGFDGLTVTRTGKNLLQGFERYNVTSYVSSPIFLKAGEQYTVSFESDIVPSAIYLRKGAFNTDAEQYKYNSRQWTFAPNESRMYLFQFYKAATGWDDHTFSNLQLELGSTATAYEPYQGETYEVEFPTEAGTVYGGELTVNADGSGSLVVDKVEYIIDGINTVGQIRGVYCNINPYHELLGVNPTQATWMCNTYVCNTSSCGYNSTYEFLFLVESAWSKVAKNETEFNAYCQQNPIQFVIPLITPITYTLTASEIRTLLGQNNIWADTGDVSVKYKADTKLYIDNKITQAIAAALNS